MRKPSSLARNITLSLFGTRNTNDSIRVEGFSARNAINLGSRTYSGVPRNELASCDIPRKTVCRANDDIVTGGQVL